MSPICPLRKDRIRNPPPVQQPPNKPTISPSPPSFHPTHPILQYKAATNGAEACNSHAAVQKEDRGRASQQGRNNITQWRAEKNSQAYRHS